MSGDLRDISKKLRQAKGMSKVKARTEATSDEHDLRTYEASEACESLEEIRNVLLIGLASYGEIERLNAEQTSEKQLGRELPDNLRVIHPTGSDETVGDFAAALINVDLLVHTIRDLAGQAPASAT